MGILRLNVKWGEEEVKTQERAHQMVLTLVLA